MALTNRPQRLKTSVPTTQTAAPRCANRIPRITRLMALAIKLQEMVDRREVRDYADLARLGHVSRARMTQIMNLLNLAPDIQEQVIELGIADNSKQVLTERHLRDVVKAVGWAEQRERWGRVRDSHPSSPISANPSNL